MRNIYSVGGLNDMIAEPNRIVIERASGRISKVTSTLPLGDKVTTISRVGGVINEIVDTYNGVTSTSTIVRNADGKITEVNRV